MFIFTQGLHALLIRQDACEKPHFMFRLHTVKITYFTDFGVQKYHVHYDYVSENGFVSCLNICLDTYEISKDKWITRNV